RPHNVVARYIHHYSALGDRVLDPFGGSGITAIEAFLANRTGIQNDINPLANFIARGIYDLSKGDIDDLKAGLGHVLEEIEPVIRHIYDIDEDKLQASFSDLQLPENIELPRNSDVSHYRELFTERQLFSLSAI